MFGFASHKKFILSEHALSIVLYVCVSITHTSANSKDYFLSDGKLMLICPDFLCVVQMVGP